MFNQRSPKEIGGYFGLDMPDYGDLLYPSALKFNSARSAMRAALEYSDYRHVWVPAYVCTSVILAAERAGCKVSTYNLNLDLSPRDIPSIIQPDTAIIYVNYFGLCDKQVEKLLEKYPKEQLLIDNSHALFSEHKGEFACVYSPRKFAGLPDGGLLITERNLDMTVALDEDLGSLRRMDYLLVRMAYSARAGYEGFNQARMSLSDSTPKQMSKLTRRLLKTILWKNVKSQRQKHFQIMHRHFHTRNAFPFQRAAKVAPLCYPLLIKNGNMAHVKKQLAEINIFTATYWQDASERLTSKSIESMLINNTLFLPIDQRLDEKDILTICDRVDTLLTPLKLS